MVWKFKKTFKYGKNYICFVQNKIAYELILNSVISQVKCVEIDYHPAYSNEKHLFEFSALKLKKQSSLRAKTTV